MLKSSFYHFINFTFVINGQENGDDISNADQIDLDINGVLHIIIMCHESMNTINLLQMPTKTNNNMDKKFEFIEILKKIEDEGTQHKMKI